MSTELEERLRSHARAFDGLLSLIPAKLYYGEDVSDQWQRKKQTPEQKRAAKMAKLDPANWRSAKDIMDERAITAKRKRESESSQDIDVAEAVPGLEEPKVIQDAGDRNPKKRKLETLSQPQSEHSALSIEEKKQKQAEKKALKKAKAQKEQDKKERQKARKQAEKHHQNTTTNPEPQDAPSTEPADLGPIADTQTRDSDQWSTASSSAEVPDIFSPPIESGASSICSIPASITDHPTVSKAPSKKNKVRTQMPASQPQTATDHGMQSSRDHEAARARLANAISSFRSARKADDPSSNKPRNRAELLEQRRRKEESKREAKKEQRRKEREEAARKEDEDIAKRFSPGGSGSLLASPRSPPTKDIDSNPNNFSYGRIEFGDGTKVDSNDLSNGFLDAHKRKGHQDPSTALKAAHNKASRLAGLDSQKRKEIEEKDMWLNAKRRAHGERVKDDTSLLKKALKRQESQKKKSEKEWTDRKDGIAKAQEAKQKKRTENLAKRKEDKMMHKVGKKGKKIKKRPGFEGSFRGRTGGKKKP